MPTPSCLLRRIAGAVGASLLPLLSAAEALSPARPNVLFVITDQQTASALGCAGNPLVKTPNLDRLAARGVRFSTSYCTYPLCTPSRASLFSSRMPHELGINGNIPAQSKLSEKGVPTLGECFQAAGYETAYAGKWHVPTAFPAYVKRPDLPGFNVLPLEGHDPRGGDKTTQQKSPSVDPHAINASIGFLRRRHDKPFLLVVSLLNPHDICEFEEYDGFRSRLPEDPSRLPPVRANHRDQGKLPSVLKIKDRIRRMTEQTWREYQWIYYRLVEDSDQRIGQLLDALEASALDRNTVVVFTSDHGEMLGAHGMQHKDQLYEEAATVPLIVAPPATGARVDAVHLVSGLDVMPTLLDYAGISIPDSLLGRSLRPLVEGREVLWRDHVVTELAEPAGRMVRTERYKYVQFARGDDREQFFDLGQDPGELRNLVSSAGLAPEVERHRGLLQAWLAKTKDPFEQAGAEAAPVTDQPRKRAKRKAP